jgi:hypothetical protein
MNALLARPTGASVVLRCEHSRGDKVVWGLPGVRRAGGTAAEVSVAAIGNAVVPRSCHLSGDRSGFLLATTSRSVH